MQSPELIGAFIVPLEKSGIPYFITGSIASIFYGEPRLTHDIDIIVHLSKTDLLRFSSFFPEEEFYCPPDEVIQIESKRRPYGHFNLIHHASGFKADIYPDGEDALHQWAFKERKKVDLGDGLSIWIAPPEYIIIRKLEYFREGGSEKHLQDIRMMLPQITASLKFPYLEGELNRRGLTQFWDQIISK